MEDLVDFYYIAKHLYFIVFIWCTANIQKCGNCPKDTPTFM